MNAPVLSVLLCALAAYRLARAIALDTISDPFRAWVHALAYEIDGPDLDSLRVATMVKDDRPADEPAFVLRSRAWSWAYALVSCPYCAGFWISLLGYAAWTELPGSHWPIAAVAVAGAQALATHTDPAVR